MFILQLDYVNANGARVLKELVCAGSDKDRCALVLLCFMGQPGLGFALQPAACGTAAPTVVTVTHACLPAQHLHRGDPSVNEHCGQALSGGAVCLARRVWRAAQPLAAVGGDGPRLVPRGELAGYRKLPLP